MNYIEKLRKREMLYQTSHTEIQIKKVYAGFDATAESLQIGNLTPIKALKYANELGIQPIVVLGGATSTVGDPSGKNTTRKQLENKTIANNLEKIKAQIQKLIPEAIIVNNADWLSNLSFIDFLEKIAKYFSVTNIINLKTFAERLKNNDPLTIKEIIYPLMQGYDFLWLFENYECNAQIGGQDQWCNLLTGIDLIQSKHNEKAVAITNPLLTDSNGSKLGKSLSGAIYLSKEKYPIYDFWNFWRNIDDKLVESCLKKFSEYKEDEISELVKCDVNQAKIALANSVTKWVHSEEDAENAFKQANQIFVEKNYNELQIIKVNKKKLSEILSDLKNISSSESKRLIKNKAIKINEETIEDIKHEISNEIILIKVGKKEIFKIQYTNL